MPTDFDPSLTRVDFDEKRHKQAVIDACIESSEAGFPHFNPTSDYLARVARRILRVNESAETDRLLLLENQDGLLVAMTWLELLVYPDGYDGDHTEQVWPELIGLTGAQIRNTWVHRDYRGKGLAMYLKQEAEQEARKAGALFLYTRCATENLPIIALNQRLHYEFRRENSDFFRLRKPLVPDLW